MYHWEPATSDFLIVIDDKCMRIETMTTMPSATYTRHYNSILGSSQSHTITVGQI